MKPGLHLRSILLFLPFGLLFCQSTKKTATTTANGQKPKSIWTTEWSYDGKYIAVGGDDSTIWIYRGKDYSLYKTFRTNSEVKGLRWHPKENLLAVAERRGMELLDMNTETLTTLPAIKTGGRAVAWNYSGELIGFADGAGKVQVLDKKGNLIRSIAKQDSKSFLSIDWHPSKNLIVTGGDDIILFDTSGKMLRTIKVREQYTGILSVKWHPSGDFFASGDYGHEKEGKPTLLQYWKEDGTKLKEMLGHLEEIRNLRWSNDGKFVATAADALRIWNTEGVLLYTGASDENLWGVAWGKDDKHIVTGSYEKGRVMLWDHHAKLIREISDSRH